MHESYYYIVAGLPDIELDNDCTCPEFPEFIRETSKAVSKRDSSLLGCLLLPYDNINLINLIEKKGGEFNAGGNFSEEEIRQGMQEPRDLPEYMQVIIEAYQSSKPVYYNISWEAQLSWLFYEWLTTIDNPFLKGWFVFELNLRNFITACRCREFDIRIERRLKTRMEQEPSQSIICKNEVTEAILGSKAPDFSLSASFPWVEDILALDSSNPLAFEKGVDRLRWEKLNDMTRFHYFGIETILAFAIKLRIAERWKRLKPRRGKEVFDKLLLKMERVYASDTGPRLERS